MQSPNEFNSHTLSFNFRSANQNPNNNAGYPIKNSLNLGRIKKHLLKIYELMLQIEIVANSSHS